MLIGSYGVSTVLEVENLMRNNMMEWIVGGRALVIGSQGFLNKVVNPHKVSSDILVLIGLGNS